MELIYDYMKDDFLRHKLNTLTRKTFDFDFENWVTGGYFEGDYIPYSFMEEGRILANVSANKMSFIQNGIPRNYIQIGTVMTDETYRRQGLARKLIEHIFKEYEDKCDGFYLFSNLNALDFYRKAGLKECFEYQYRLKKEWLKGRKRGAFFKRADKQDEQMKIKYMDAVRNSAVNSALEQMNKFGLQMFYTADMNNVYYAEDIDCFVVMERFEDTLSLQSVISREHISVEEVIARIDMEYGSLKLGYVPCAEDVYMFDASVYDGEDDYRLFYRGGALKSIEREMLFFPELSHA